MRENLSPEEEIEQQACWELIRDLKGFLDNIEENFEDPDRLNDFLVDDKVIPINLFDDINFSLINIYIACSDATFKFFLTLNKKFV